MAKEGSTVSGLMDTFATAISLALQYGVPLRDLVNKFAHVRFEPSGFTGNAEIPIAKSIIDYIFRWLGSRFLAGDDRAALGLVDRSGGAGGYGSGVGFGAPPLPVTSPLATANPLAPAPEEGPSAVDEAIDEPPSRPTAVAAAPVASDAGTPANGTAAKNGNGRANGNGNGKGAVASAFAASLGADRAAFTIQADAPSCADCGSIMVRNGSCYKCLNCGSTSGCS